MEKLAVYFENNVLMVRELTIEDEKKNQAEIEILQNVYGMSKEDAEKIINPNWINM